MSEAVHLIQQTDEDRAAEAAWRAAWLRGPDPARVRWAELPPQLGDPAPDLELRDTRGHARRLSEFWSHGAAVILFLRHFGCSCLAERWEQLRADVPAFEKAGAAVVAICQAPPERALAVATRRGYAFPLLCDADRQAYRRYGVLEGTAAQVLHDYPWRPGDADAGDELIEQRRGTERAMVDNPWQLPAEFVVGSDGRIVHAHRYQYCEDFPPASVVLGALAAAGG